ncbi:hypothetical protein FF38_01094 [Lucilia cuprina]|uniref:Zinc finger PHD-type domain-containing protein n=1 Tax=Lucilia cuprina TaxID=7375 RepID=A0A0L0C7E1_LUCCU|nr:hypothetical protein FF38_01094 [Lucilia cuprina]
MPYLCGVCDLDTTGTRCLLCRSCDSWFHADCENVTKVLFTTLDKNRNFTYTCKGCIENPPDNSDDAFKAEMRKQFSTLNNSINGIISEQSVIKAKVDSVISEVRAELSNSLKEIKEEMASCKYLVNLNDTAYKKKFYELEMQNHMLQHRFNRADIVITGLSNNIDDLIKVAYDLCEHLKVNIDPGDILNALYIKKGNAILVKFGQIVKRDKVISEYFKQKSLKVSDIIGGSNEKRVYLNDNYTTLANKLLKICWKLKSDEKINGFNIINREILIAKITMINGDVKTLNYQECIDLFKLNPK